MKRKSHRKFRRRPPLSAEFSFALAGPDYKDSARIRIGGVPKLKSPAGQKFANAVRRSTGSIKPDSLARLLGSLGHPQRIQLLLTLLAGQCNHKQLAAVTGLKAGPLYHHLRELRMADLIGPKSRDEY